MTRRATAVGLLSLAVALFLSRYVFALWYRGTGQRTVWGPEDFANFLGCVGITPWVFAGGFLLAGVVYMVLAERDR
jgi:hypothetical protein